MQYDEIEETVDMIHEILMEGEGVFVHCMGGFSRSPAIVMAYLMKYRKLIYFFSTKKGSIMHNKAILLFIIIFQSSPIFFYAHKKKQF